MSKHTLSVLTENKPGVLARVAGLFSRRGFNIESLAVGPTEHADVSRMTIVVQVDELPLECDRRGGNHDGGLVFDSMPDRGDQVRQRLAGTCAGLHEQVFTGLCGVRHRFGSLGAGLSDGCRTYQACITTANSAPSGFQHFVQPQA